MDYQTIEKKLEVFGFNMLQDFVTLLQKMEQEGLLIEDVQNFVASKKMEAQKNKEQRVEHRKKWLEKSLKCPHCETPMQLLRGDSNDCFWVCRKCRYSEYRLHGIDDELKSIGIKPEK